jgi:flagellar biogenesis protein FliO
MATSHFSPTNPWNPKRLVLGLILGVCFFQILSLPARAEVDQKSRIFQQDSDASSLNSKSSQAVPLPEETPKPLPGFFSTFARILLALGLTVALIYATVWGLKLVWEKRGLKNLQEDGKQIKIISSAYLAPRKTLHLVEIGKRILVVGVGHEEVHCLDVITGAEEVESLREGSRQGFPAIFQKVLRKQEAAPEEGAKTLEESAREIGGYVEKLKKMSQRSDKTPGQGSGGEK